MKNIFLHIWIYILKPGFLSDVIMFSLVFIGAFLFVQVVRFIITKKFTTINKKYVRVFDFLYLHTALFLSIPVVIFFTAMAGILFPTPRVSYPTSPAFGLTSISDIKPLVLEFNRPVSQKNLDIIFSPDIKGQWKSALHKKIFTTKLLFYPDSSLPQESDYAVTVNNIQNIFGTSPKIKFLFNFRTPVAPKVKSVSPADKKQDVGISDPIIVTLDQPDNSTNNWDFKLTPEAQIDISKDISSKVYTLKLKSPLLKGTDYELSVFRKPIAYNFITKKSVVKGEEIKVYTSTFKTLPSPTIKSFSPSGSGIATNTPVKIEFQQPMNKNSVETAWKISPETKGKLTWTNDQELIFTPEGPWQKNTHYTITIGKTATSFRESAFDEDYSNGFTTIGYVLVSSFSPGNGAGGVSPNQAISITFNQGVDNASAQPKFSITPNIAGTFSWKNNTMTFSHGDLGYSLPYTLKIDVGVKSTGGIDSNQIFSSSFTTRDQSVTLNVPSYRQSNMYTCYASAARSALALKGISTSESTILNKIGYDNTPWSGSWNEPGSTWGDPNKGIVGDVNGKANNIGWGYGVYWGPVASAINSLGRPAEAKSGWSVQGIAAEIAAGNPVIIWWVNGVWPAYEVFWYNNGNRIRGVNSLHVQTVKGFTGSVDNPKSFTLTDSGYGYPSKNYSIDVFKARWSWFNNSAVVVR